jgi:hypothetical protein
MTNINVTTLGEYIESYIDAELAKVGLSAVRVDNPRPIDYSWRMVGVIVESDDYASEIGLRAALEKMMGDILVYNTRDVVQFFQNDYRFGEFGRQYTEKYGISIWSSPYPNPGIYISWKVTNE